MLFNSFAYAIFLPIVFILYWVIPNKYRWVLLLTASYYFYMSWNVKYIVLILLTTVVSYTAACLLEKTNNKTKQNYILGVACIICLGVLFLFKYYNFFAESITRVLIRFTIPVHPMLLKVMLPVGISFYTFQTLSYVIDVYRGTVKPEHHFGIYATFISFFPQLVAGPIERTENLLPQIKKEHRFDYAQAMYGAKLMLWGFFKKLIIADQLAKYVDLAYESPYSYYGFDFLVAIFFFTIQIYCDFSGYSDIAIGTAKLLNIDLMTNFKSPYFSASVKEFWSRWHISLSTWFKDYVYIPLGGNRCSKIRHAGNLMLTFFISGLWHGANWTFVIWGGIHGFAQVLENACSRWLKPIRKNKFGRILAILFVFCFTNIAWVFFRAKSLHDACYVIRHVFDGITNPVGYLRNNMNLSIQELLFLLLMILILAIFDYFQYKKDVIKQIGSKHKVLQWIFYIFLGLLIVFFSQKGVAAEFVYFQF